jgi:peroxiredoxin
MLNMAVTSKQREETMLRSRSHLSLVLSAVLLAGLSLSVHAAPKVGEPAPVFSGTDPSGKTWTLSELRGQPVILEWTNHDCPYVKKHYESDNMQALQREATADGYLWLSVISSAPGKQGHVSPEQADALTTERQAAPTAVLLDESGEIGRAYGARTTPQMFVIDADGVLVYMGGIDDRPTTNPADIPGATNYVRAALAERDAGEPVSQPVTRPYGCSVKY